MADRKYYVMCALGCKAEAMTKEQIYAAIAEATGNVPNGVDDAFITRLLEQNKKAAMRLWVGTEAEYNALVAKGEINPDTVYFIKNGDVARLKNPTRGVDYWTPEDRAQMVDDVLNALSYWEGGSY